MRRMLLLATAALALAACLRSREFRISGTITIAAPVRPRAPRQNVVLFIVAKNKGGVPVAVRRIVNPRFPVWYSLTTEDMIIPGVDLRQGFLLQVQMNTHGHLGAQVKGDLEGSYSEPVYSGAKEIHIVIDRQI
ncbi:MAG: hypothetical protein A3J74_06965 [Elusimicrobia bacterium RIFCSPHIGHO2_02_FULL_57_9]|nr:MAG: hypothetical protein A3J74_06965 [Elusimicrobia bacterium RIFCSPHIGHO2_02_FULL_57_9]